MVFKKAEDSGKKILALIILTFLMFGLPLLTLSFGIFVVFTIYNWYLLFRTPSIGGAIIPLILSLSSFISFHALRDLIRWLRK